MAPRNPQLNWDQLLDGGIYVLDLDEIGWPRGLNDLRAKVHYEADRRRGIAHTHKINGSMLEIQAEGARIQRRAQGTCSCDAKPHQFHQITCASFGEHAAAIIGGPHYSGRSQPAPQEQPPTPTVEAIEPDDEALLGPCTCGQAPLCLPTCARAGG